MTARPDDDTSTPRPISRDPPPSHSGKFKLVADLDVIRHVRTESPWMLSQKQRNRRFPTRLIRYYLPYNYLIGIHQRLKRPLRVCEVGIGNGQMRCFLGESLVCEGRVLNIGEWVGVDVNTDKATRGGYDKLVRSNLECDEMPCDFDVYILLHIIEHLRKPEAALTRLVERMKNDSYLIIGVPCHPNFAIAMRERQLMKEANSDFGHASAFSRRRIRRFANQSGMEVLREDGGYLLRASGFCLEDFKVWLRFNLAFGEWFPGFPGEYYTCLHKS